MLSAVTLSAAKGLKLPENEILRCAQNDNRGLRIGSSLNLNPKIICIILRRNRYSTK